jgi:hypothetical protein
VRAEVHKPGCLNALEEGTLVERMWGSASGYTGAGVGRASKIGEAEIGQGL